MDFRRTTLVRLDSELVLDADYSLFEATDFGNQGVNAPAELSNICLQIGEAKIEVGESAIQISKPAIVIHEADNANHKPGQ